MLNHSLGEFQELVLLIVATLKDEAYGVSILKNLEKETGKKLNISAIHMALKRMEEKGFVESTFGGITNEREGRRKKYYVITSLGRSVLDQQYEIRTKLYHKIPNTSIN